MLHVWLLGTLKPAGCEFLCSFLKRNFCLQFSGRSQSERSVGVPESVSIIFLFELDKWKAVLAVMMEHTENRGQSMSSEC